ncbi:signal peptide prediction [Ramlibacter sp. AN1133]|uniref:signal peptide prediction n=1 Tax=Ramlibacter sp. AN1133 TaxID=3133429 RepID=UPI0030BECF9C
MVAAVRLFRYLWAIPYTLLGLLLGGLAALLGATVRRHHGVIEIYGGRAGAAVARLPRLLGFSAMTLGHVILAVDRSALAQLRRHEHVHVRQYERWGPLFVPAYLLSSLVQLLRGRNPYRENHFERQAYALAPARRRASATHEQVP